MATILAVALALATLAVARSVFPEPSLLISGIVPDAADRLRRDPSVARIDAFGSCWTDVAFLLDSGQRYGTAGGSRGGGESLYIQQHWIQQLDREDPFL